MTTVAQNIAVIGLGRVGLPFSLVLAEAGYRVVGIDTDPNKLAAISTKMMPFKEEGAAKLLQKHGGKRLKGGKLSDLKRCNTVVICIGTFLNEPSMEPDLSAVYELFDAILPYLSANSLLILRSTVHPHGTEIIYEYLRTHTKQPFHLVYAPERISEGFAITELLTLPQIIGSFDASSAKLAEAFFARFAPEILHTDPLSAELSKLVLNTYRYSQFALANELMMIVEHYGRDIYTILQLANKNYKRGGIPSPGFAAGPCLVKDSFFLRHSTPYNTLITGSYAINSQVVDYVIEGLQSRMDLKDKKIAVLGLAFKKNIDDSRGSLSLKLVERLSVYKCSVEVHDPYLAKSNLSEVLAKADAVLIGVDHDEYKTLDKKILLSLVGKPSLVCDLWNVLGMNKIFFETGVYT
jgi:UDP-N-acetyl-D-mannosaminuronic acid dehydrogenase